MRKLQICVTGSALHLARDMQSKLQELAWQVGKEIADQGAILVIGGRESVDHLPTHAHKGATEQGGTSLVIVEGTNRDVFNYPNTIVLPCGMNDSPWEVLIGLSCDAIIAIGGRAGSLIEILTAYKTQATIIALEGTGGVAEEYSGRALDSRDLSKVISAKTPHEAVATAIDISRGRLLKR